MSLKFGLLSILLLLLYLPFALFGTRSDYLLPSDGVWEGDLLKATGKIIISGTVKGDAFAFGNTVRNPGQVTGDFLAAGSYIHHSGRLIGSARLLGRELFIDGVVERNLSAVGMKFTVNKDALIKGNLVFTGSDIDVAGRIQGGLLIRADSVVLGGIVQNDVEIYANSLKILPTAKFSGKVTYFGPKLADISTSATFDNPLVYKPLESPANPWQQARQSVVAILLLSVITSWLLPKHCLFISKKLIQRPGHNLLLGTLFAILCPILIALFFLVRAGWYSAGVLLSISLGLGISAVFLGQVAWGAVLGRLIWKFAEKKFSLPEWSQTPTIIVQTVSGTLLVAFFVQLPYVGYLLTLLFATTTLGVLIQQLFSNARWQSKAVVSGTGLPR